MGRKLCHLAALIFTFAFGVACAASFRALIADQPEAHLADPTPRIRHSDEAVLRANLSQLRGLIDRYETERGEYPKSLHDLVLAGYVAELPVDPMTGEREWRPEGWVCPTGTEIYFFAVTGVRSKSGAISSDGTPYGEW